MRFKVGDRVVLAEPNAVFNKTTYGEYFVNHYQGKTVYTVTSVTNDFTRIEGEETGWFHHTFIPFKKVPLPEELFTL